MKILQKNTIKFVMVTLLLATVIQSAYFVKTKTAKVQLLNKRTGAFVVADIKVGSVYKFDGKLFVLVRSCAQSSKQDDPENVAFFQVAKTFRASNNNVEPNSINSTLPLPVELNNVMPKDFKKYFLFSGFMYSSSPSANTLEDAEYDITLLSCTN